MKSNQLTLFLITLMFLFVSTGASAQIKGNKNVIKKSFDVPHFDQLKVGGAFNVVITTGDSAAVEIETDENLMEYVHVAVENDQLELKMKSVRKWTKLNAYIQVKSLNKLVAHGASDVSSEQVITAEMFELKASGASDVDLVVAVESLHTDISGASTVTLKGSADHHSIEASGASTLKAFGLQSTVANADVSGASTVKVSVSDELTGQVSGAADIIYEKEPEHLAIYKKSGGSHVEDRGHREDTTRVTVGGVEIEVIEGDSVKVRVGTKEIVVDDDGHVKIQKRYKRKFNGHWAGFDIGFNGYVNDNYTMDFPMEYEYLDLRMEKSVIVNINFFEQNIPISKNQRFGATTGLGLSLPNYRFRRSTHLKSDSSYLIGYMADGISVRKSKLSMMYLTIPVLFEYQTNSWHRKNSFHIGAGMIMSARILSWTKVYYNELNKDFLLTRFDPETGSYEPELAATSPGRPKVHNSDDWFLRPVKFDATVRIGWGFINLWATFSVNSMFRNNRGPEVYPWSAGITLINF